MNGKIIAIEDVLGEVLSLEKTVSSLKGKILNMMPLKLKYGGNVWWEQETVKSLEDYRNGDYLEVKDKKGLNSFLSGLKK